MRCCAGSVYFSPNPGNMSQIMQILRLPPGSGSSEPIFLLFSETTRRGAMSWIIQTRNLSSLKDSDDQVGTDYLSQLCTDFRLEKKHFYHPAKKCHTSFQVFVFAPPQNCTTTKKSHTAVLQKFHFAPHKTCITTKYPTLYSSNSN